MRVLLLGPRYEDSFVDNVTFALEAMGHEVFGSGAVAHAAYWSLPRRLVRLAEERLFGDKPHPEERALVPLCERVRPDILLALTWDVHPEILDRLGKTLRGRRILWWGDAPANSRRLGLVNPGWDKVYVKDREAVTKLRLVGKDAELLHEAMNPRWHRPLAQRKNDALVIAGNYYSFRQAVVVRLARDGVALQLFGSPPPRWSAPEVMQRHSGKYVTCDEKSRVFGEGMACLNTFAFAEGNSLNCRAFEIAGAGGLQLLEHRPIVEECFEPGKELLVFRTYEELMGHIDRAKRFPAEVLPIREAGAKRALAEHTHRHRLEVVLRDLG